MQLPEITNELVNVKICYGYGIVFHIEILARIGASEEKIKEAAIEHFKRYMPTREEIDSVESMLAEKKAWIELEHEFKQNKETQ